jgi:hypothetical protein
LKLRAGILAAVDMPVQIRGLTFRNNRLKHAGDSIGVFIVPGLPAIKRNEMIDSIKEIAGTNGYRSA